MVLNARDSEMEDGEVEDGEVEDWEVLFVVSE
jgi:hypothetical protein